MADPVAAAQVEAAPQTAASGDAARPPTLADLWSGDAEFVVDRRDSGLPMGESDTVILADGRYRSYVHASDRSLGVVDSCGAPVAFPGCVVTYESADGGGTFTPARDDAGQVRCLIPCRACPCESRRDHVDQQQYPRVVKLPAGDGAATERWLMAYEYRGSVFVRSSTDGLSWSAAGQLPQTGVWETWLMPCRTEEVIGPHPYAPHEYDCLVGGPPGIVVSGEGGDAEVFAFVGLGQNPGSMGCYRGNIGSHAALLRKCEANPLFTGADSYGEPAAGDGRANGHFDFRTVSSAEAVEVGDVFYMLYEGVRGPEPGAAGDTQFGLGLARALSDRIDGPWEKYAGNPILVDLPGNIGVGHADVVVDAGETVLFTSLDGETRSRLVLRWR